MTGIAPWLLCYRYGYSWVSCIGDFGRGGAGMPPLNYTFPPALKVDYVREQTASTSLSGPSAMSALSAPYVPSTCFDWRVIISTTHGTVASALPGHGRSQGEPIGLCKESAAGSGKFVREWTKVRPLDALGSCGSQRGIPF